MRNIFPLTMDLEDFLPTSLLLVGCVCFAACVCFRVCFRVCLFGVFFNRVCFFVCLFWGGLFDGGARQLHRSARAICGFHKSPEQGLNLSES